MSKSKCRTPLLVSLLPHFCLQSMMFGSKFLPFVVKHDFKRNHKRRIREEHFENCVRSNISLLFVMLFLPSLSQRLDCWANFTRDVCYVGWKKSNSLLNNNYCRCFWCRVMLWAVLLIWISFTSFVLTRRGKNESEMFL